VNVRTPGRKATRPVARTCPVRQPTRFWIWPTTWRSRVARCSARRGSSSGWPSAWAAAAPEPVRRGAPNAAAPPGSGRIRGPVRRRADRARERHALLNPARTSGNPRRAAEGTERPKGPGGVPERREAIGARAFRLAVADGRDPRPGALTAAVRRPEAGRSGIRVKEGRGRSPALPGSPHPPEAARVPGRARHPAAARAASAPAAARAPAKVEAARRARREATGSSPNGHHRRSVAASGVAKSEIGAGGRRSDHAATRTADPS
jgi:hypothetical protein